MDNMTMDELSTTAKQRGTTVTALMKKRKEDRMGRDLTVKEVAERINQSTSTVYTLLRVGAFPGAYRGGVEGKTSPWLVPESAIDQYRANRAA